MSIHERIIDFDRPGEATRVANGIRKMRGKWRMQMCRYKPRRSDEQNRWLFGAIYPPILEAIQGETGEQFSKEQLHEAMKTKFAPSVDVVNPKTSEFEMSVALGTSEMTTEQFSDYLEHVRRWAAEHFDLDIPDPRKQETIR